MSDQKAVQDQERLKTQRADREGVRNTTDDILSNKDTDNLSQEDLLEKLDGGTICEFCNEAPAIHLEPLENGPTWGLSLEDGSDRFCSHYCWESDIQLRNKIADEDS